MKLRRKLLVPFVVSAMLATLVISLGSGTAGAAPGVRQIPAGGTSQFRPGGTGTGEIQFPEFPGAREGDEGAPDPDVANVHDRRMSRGHGVGVPAAPRTIQQATLGTSFNGLNFRDQRTANGGNQFSVEPPDQGLCVGNGFVVEAVNTVLRVFDTSGSPLTGVVDLNTFFGYPAQFNRTTGLQGPFVTDPSCLFDQATQRWYLVILTLDVFPDTGEFTGTNHIDLAVSNTDSPLGAWTIYRLSVQDDGTDGTPDHNCNPDPNPFDGVHPPTNPTACIGDYPHIGADANAFYVTTNEYDLFGPSFQAAQIYAFSKSQLAANASAVTVVQFDTQGLVHSSQGVQPGFTVWPANVPGTAFATGAGGTEYFLSSNAAEEATGIPNSQGIHRSKELIVWGLTNTSSIDSSSPSLNLSNAVLRVKRYELPARSDQKAGDFPLGQCLNDTTSPTPFGPGCWQLFFLPQDEPPHNQVIGQIDSNDSRMQQVYLANGLLYGALDTAVEVRGQDQAGIEFFVVRPSVSASGTVGGSVRKDGYVAVANNNVIYPAIGVNSSGKGAMAFTLVGADHHPSAAFTSISQEGVGPVQIAAEGVGVQDGFTEYPPFIGQVRPRWGDYGAAVPVGSSIWIASEYIAQSCTLAEYLTAPIGSCGGTRASLGNWATRISKVTP
jgi:hypothetical protein